jgi:hypothetical protein
MNMKNLWLQLIDFLFDWRNKQVAEMALPFALSELTSYGHTVRLTKISLRQAITIRTRMDISDNQLRYLLKLLPFHLSNYGYGLTIRNDEIWVTRINMQSDYAL